MSWRELGSYTMASRVGGVGVSQIVGFGCGQAHAVLRDGDRYTALCGRFVRMWSHRRWSASWGDEMCPDCERLAAAQHASAS